MAVSTKNQFTIPKGTDKKLVLTVLDPSGAVVDLVGARVRFTMVKQLNCPELIVKDSDVGATEVDMAGAASGVVCILLVPDDTAGPDPNNLAFGNYLYDVCLIIGGKTYQVVFPTIMTITKKVTTFP